MIPCLEPISQQEAYNMMAYAFETSEQFKVPIVLRITTRLAHSRANVSLTETLPQNEISLPEDKQQFVLLPSIARRNYAKLVEKQADFIKASENSPYNKYIDGSDKSLGIIACGITYNYLMESYQGSECPYPILKIGQYPLPQKQLQKLMDSCDKVIVLEEGMPFVEEMLTGPLGSNGKVIGRLTGDLPRVGELNPAAVCTALGLELAEHAEDTALACVRPPRLCDGCPHIYSYDAMLEAMKDVEPGHVFGDIGCYTLGALPPFQAINTCVDMGGSITVAKGAADAGVLPAVAVIGDSTFTHSGLTGILDAVWENTPMTVMLLDNYTTGMTGGQDSIGFGKFEQMVAGLGVDPEHIRVIDPKPRNHEENTKIIREELDYHGLSVIIAQRECIQTLRRKAAKAKG